MRKRRHSLDDYCLHKLVLSCDPYACMDMCRACLIIGLTSITVSPLPITYHAASLFPAILPLLACDILGFWLMIKQVSCFFCKHVCVCACVRYRGSCICFLVFDSSHFVFCAMLYPNGRLDFFMIPKRQSRVRYLIGFCEHRV